MVCHPVGVSGTVAVCRNQQSLVILEEPLSEPICWVGNKKKREDIMADSRISLVSGEKPTLFDVPEDTLAKH